MSNRSRVSEARSRRHVGGEAGFTLVELIVGLFLTGIIGSAFVTLLVSQDRFYSRLDQTLAALKVLAEAPD